MGYDIPEPYVWDESFRVFYDNIDEEHKGLFKGVFDCAGDKSSGAKLKHLITVVATHFRNEEGMMDAAKYDAVVPHKQAHHDFEAKLAALKTPLDQGTIDFAKDWLVNHIKGTDFKYKGKL
uniref:Hemerythrin n=6 Tax=Lophotrochozoa TaxID=1206795 RepID=A0A1S6QCX5_9ANNE|nr:hemerythrin [Arichlidon gathofi]AQV13608.1 hemerythrin [Chaetozone sp. EP-2017]AQV13651.1 hemerythrin [Glycinde armigera]AQV13782.1 hemerythrin [Thysanocardia nigra]AQV13784.1 hemerythrin [Tomopteris sp. EP-2017]ASW22284.1 hemerythrin [Novocrania anomala]